MQEQNVTTFFFLTQKALTDFRAVFKFIFNSVSAYPSKIENCVTSKKKNQEYFFLKVEFFALMHETGRDYIFRLIPSNAR